MSERPFVFEVYRLNVVDEPDLFTLDARQIRSDDDIKQVFRGATDSKFDLTTTSGRNRFLWSIREFVDLDGENPEATTNVVSVTLARSVLAQAGKTVTDSSIEEALSELTPPAAEIAHLLIYFDRHLIVAEYNSVMMSTNQWRYSLQEMLDRSAIGIGYMPGIRVEPVPREEEILRAFRSFDTLTRLRVRLRLPNPELDRRTEKLRKEMLNGNIRDYAQDMRNPKGLSRSEEALPFATAAMAQAGYKEGEVILTGYQGGKIRTARTGNRALRGRLDGLKGFIRGIAANAKAKETQTAVAAILSEVDRLAEPPIPPQ